MNRETTFAPLSQILSAFLNDLQDNAGPIGSMNGVMVGGDLIQSSNGTDVIVSRIRGLTIGQNYGFSSVSSHTVTPGFVVKDTWGYIYADLAAGVNFAPSTLSLSVSTTGPDSSLIFKTSDVTKRYVGCFRTYDSGAGVKILPFRASRRRYRYSFSKVLNNGLLILNNVSTPVTPTALLNTPLVESGGTSALIPPHARWAELYAQVTNDGSGGASNGVSAEFMTDTADAGPSIYVPTGDVDNGHTSQASGFFTIETTAGAPQQVAYRVSATNVLLDVWVTGFEEG